MLDYKIVNDPISLTLQGAPETIQERLINVPAWYVETYKKHTRQGSRVLALAYKSLPDMTVRKFLYTLAIFPILVLCTSKC